MKLCWLFVWAVAAWDCWFAYRNSGDFDEWELNPLARWLGPFYAIGLRLGSTGLAQGVSRLRPRTVTAAAVSIHALLLAWYIALWSLT